MYPVHDFCNSVKLRLCLMEELPSSILQVDNSQVLSFWYALDEDARSNCLKIESQTIIEHILEKIENTDYFQTDQVNSHLYKEI